MSRSRSSAQAARRSTTARFELKNVMVSSFVAPGDVAGMKVAGIVLATPDVETFSLNFEEIKQTFGTHRIVGTTARCGSPTNAGNVVFSHTFGAVPAGNFAANATAPTQRDPLSVASIRFFDGESGFARQEGCSNIIAVLIGL